MRDDLVVTDLVTRARDGDKQAWDALVDRYAPLLWSICRRHRVGGADAGVTGRAMTHVMTGPGCCTLPPRGGRWCHEVTGSTNAHPSGNTRKETS